jgi:predicted transcriptional regulator
MEPECRKIAKEVAPAVRAYVIDIMHDKYKYKQQEIADRLGMAQVAVSKYLNRKYSREVARLKVTVGRELDGKTLKSIMESRNADEANEAIERSSERFVYA